MVLVYGDFIGGWSYIVIVSLRIDTKAVFWNRPRFGKEIYFNPKNPDEEEILIFANHSLSLFLKYFPRTYLFFPGFRCCRFYLILYV